jgi:formate-dependent nitrite reductase membrane component NrfD
MDVARLGGLRVGGRSRDGGLEFQKMSLVQDPEKSLATYYGQPLLKEPVWIWTVPAYFYVGGVAGAALVLGATAQIQDDGGSLLSLVRKSRWIGLVGETSGAILLIADLGRPERFLNMLRVLNPRSPLSIGSWVLAVGGTLSGASVLLPGRLGNAAGLAAGALGVPLAGYTGVLLASSAIPVWQGARRSLPVLFVASAVASCASLLEMMEFSPREEKVVRTFSVIGKAAELICMETLETELSKVGERPLRDGLSGTLWTASKVLTAASLVVTLMPGQSKKNRIAGVLGTLAGLGLRFAVFHAGVRSSRSSNSGR